MNETLLTIWNAGVAWYLARPLYLKTMLGVCALLAAVLLLSFLGAGARLLFDYLRPGRRTARRGKDQPSGPG